MNKINKALCFNIIFHQLLAIYLFLELSAKVCTISRLGYIFLMCDLFKRSSGSGTLKSTFQQFTIFLALVQLMFQFHSIFASLVLVRIVLPEMKKNSLSEWTFKFKCICFVFCDSYLIWSISVMSKNHKFLRDSIYVWGGSRVSCFMSMSTRGFFYACYSITCVTQNKTR